MKFFGFYIWLALIILAGCEMSIYKKHEIPKSEQAVNDVLGKIANSLKEKCQMRPIATNVAMPGGCIKLLGLDFHIRGPLSKKEIRKILMNSASEFLELINTDISVRQYLNNYPFNIENVDITLFLISVDGKRVEDPYIGIAGISHGILEYLTLIDKDIPIIISEFEEPYEEALKELQSQ